MEKNLENLWRKAFIQIGAESHHGRYWNKRIKRLWNYEKNSLQRHFEKALAAFNSVGAETWRRGQRAYLRKEIAVAYLDPGARFNLDYPKFLHLALAVATGDWSEISASEAIIVEEALSRLPESERSGFPTPRKPTRDIPHLTIAPGENIATRATFLWKHQHRKGLCDGWARSSTMVTISGVAEDEAPVAFRLRRGDGNGFLDFRKFEGRLFRPVLSAGNWDPIRVDDFVDALHLGPAWRDNPMLARVVMGERSAKTFHNLMPLRSFAEEWSEKNATDRKNEAEYEAAALKRCGTFIAIDGIAYRNTEEPRFRLFTRRRPEPKSVIDLRRSGHWTPAFEWRTENLGMIDDQSTFIVRNGEKPEFDFTAGITSYQQELNWLSCSLAEHDHITTLTKNIRKISNTPGEAEDELPLIEWIEEPRHPNANFLLTLARFRDSFRENQDQSNINKYFNDLLMSANSRGSNKKISKLSHSGIESIISAVANHDLETMNFLAETLEKGLDGFNLDERNLENGMDIAILATIAEHFPRLLELESEASDELIGAFNL